MDVLLRVLVADGGFSINDSLTALLSEYEGVSVFGCAQEPAKVMALIEAVHPDVVILDLPAHQPARLSLLEPIKRLHPVPTVIALGDSELPQFAEAAYAAGADHFLDKAIECGRLEGLLCELGSRHRASPRGHRREAHVY